MTKPLWNQVENAVRETVQHIVRQPSRYENGAVSKPARWYDPLHQKNQRIRWRVWRRTARRVDHDLHWTLKAHGLLELK